MANQRQFVNVLFNPWDRKSYTYHWDGEPIEVGAMVVIETKHGAVEATVSGVRPAALEPPEFETKPILEVIG